MAEGHNYFSATGFDVSTDNKLLTYGIDLLSRRQYDIYIKHETGKFTKTRSPIRKVIWCGPTITRPFYTAKSRVTPFI
ncbi:MAG: hypothetical protein IPH68_12840 [Chitinophagaceae bacterium]|nr:hypothetical protein [Chitinophagaceae bacterium]